MKTKTLLTTIALIISTALSAQIIYVPTNQPTIQEGIDACPTGDTVVVEEGTYYENINFEGNAITVASRFILDGDPDHITNTIIDGSQPEDPDYGSVVTFDSVEDTTSVIMGFTITGGTGTWVPAFNLFTGGGIFCNLSGASILNNHIKNNNIITNYYGAGAGISAGPPDTYAYIIIRNNKIHNNYISANEFAEGGGISFRSAGLVADNEIYENLIETSIQYSNGAGIYCGGWEGPAYVDIMDNHIYGNEAFSSSSGEVCCQGGGMMIYKNNGIISHNVIVENYLNGETICRGAGLMIAVVDESLIVEGNWISKNDYIGEGQCWGGGIHIFDGSPTLFNNVISQNKASVGGGLYIYTYINQSDPTQIINNTITENTATEYSGGMYLYESYTIVMNTIFWDNEAPEDPEIYGYDSNLEVVYSDIAGDWPGEGNIDDDPDFRDDSCHLHESSACMDEGIDEIDILGTTYYAPLTDMDGQERPNGDFDIGADEWYPLVGIVDPVMLYESRLDLSAYPNPSCGISEIKYKIPVGSWQSAVGSQVDLSVYDIDGQKIRALVNEIQPAGEYSVRFDGADLPVGVYFIRLQAGDRVETVKMVLVR